MKQDGNGNGVGNETEVKAWSLEVYGMLWKEVLEYTPEDFQNEAEAFVKHLQDSIQPTDVLQELLLDRIAAGYLRKQLFLRFESARRGRMKIAARDPKLSTERNILITNDIALDVWYKAGELIRYEALLDQAMHQDLVLLDRLKKTAAATTSGIKKRKSAQGMIEGEVVRFDVG
jgi:hypothetical protein